jgi:hypothetical protein
MFHDAAALTFLLTVPFPKILQSFSRASYRSSLIAFPRASEQKHNCAADICEVNPQADTAWQSHFVQAASQRRTVSQVVMLFDGA